ncbi:MAG: ferrous iron transport protein A [Spirochaetales bacterium]|nr:ferrous iron transport protein A [Spirochaetales bacterium]
MKSDTTRTQSLTSLSAGKRMRIALLDGGREFRSRMLNLGIIPGETITVVRGGGSMPLVVEVKGTKVMLGRGAAVRIYGVEV